MVSDSTSLLYGSVKLYDIMKEATKNVNNNNNKKLVIIANF